MDTQISGQLFKIGAVSRITGISKASLRAWERRYGYGSSGKTSTKQRLYSAADIDELLWIKERPGDGMQISQIMELIKRIQEPTQLSMHHSPTYSDALEQRVEKIFAHMRNEEFQIVDFALSELAIILGGDQFVTTIISPLFKLVGEAWENGNITIFEEHRITNYLRLKIQHLIHQHEHAEILPDVILACAPGELHEGGLLIFWYLLTRSGWRAIYLGQDTPMEEMLAAVKKLNVKKLVVSASTITTGKHFSSIYQSHRDRQDIHLFYCGAGFDNHGAAEMPDCGTFLGNDYLEAIQKVIKDR